MRSVSIICACALASLATALPSNSRTGVAPFGHGVVREHAIYPTGKGPSRKGYTFDSSKSLLSRVVGSSKRDNASALQEKDKEYVIEYVRDNFGLEPDVDYTFDSAVLSDLNEVTAIHLRQVVNGLRVWNGYLNINVGWDMDKGRSAGVRRVISYGNSFWKDNSYISRGNSPRQATFVLDRPSEGSDRVSDADELTPMDALVAFAHQVNVRIGPEVNLIAHAQEPTMVDSAGAKYMEFQNVDFAENRVVQMAKGWHQTEDGRLELVYNVRAELDGGKHWYNGFVSGGNGKLLALNDWVSDADIDWGKIFERIGRPRTKKPKTPPTKKPKVPEPVTGATAQYNVFPVGMNDPSEGDRRIANDIGPTGGNTVASPLGWHDQGNGQMDTVVGNNVVAQIDHGSYDQTADELNNKPAGNRPRGKRLENGLLSFDFPLNLKKEPEAYADAACTNLFYWINYLHDLTYHYGFDEKSGNFQETNFGRGGRGGDPVIANAQSSEGMNNAYFSTPPDGESGKVVMFRWDTE